MALPYSLAIGLVADGHVLLTDPSILPGSQAHPSVLTRSNSLSPPSAPTTPVGVHGFVVTGSGGSVQKLITLTLRVQ